MDKTERQIRFYSSLLITLLLSSGMLLALRDNSLAARFLQIDPAEIIYQVILQFGFCYLMFSLNLKNNQLTVYRKQNKLIWYFLFNLLILLIFMLFCGILQRLLFQNERLHAFFWASYSRRFLLAGILIGILVKIVLLMRQARQHATENEQLKSAYATAELNLLKEQLNPHFLFNSLSSLSGVVREDPELAQHYIKHLSQVFRYTLVQPAHHLVSVKDELEMVSSFAQLLKLRLEDAFQLSIDVDKRYLEYLLPHLSLQPLLENAAKHNAATIATPLQVMIRIDDAHLVVSNNLQPVNADSNGIGLINLNERFRILLQKEITLEKSEENFLVRLPLKHE